MLIKSWLSATASYSGNMYIPSALYLETMPRPIKKYRSKAVEFYEDARGFYYLRMFEGVEVTMAEAVRLSEWANREASGEYKPLLVELGYGSSIASGVETFFGQRWHKYSTADAILIGTFAHKVMATFYMRHFKPALPTRVFSDVFDALAWIDKVKAAS